jgi:hypothetical protein
VELSLSNPVSLSSRRFLERECEFCGKQFNAPMNNVVRGWSRHCSRVCAAYARESMKPRGKSDTVKHRRARLIWKTRHGGIDPVCWCGLPADVHHKDGNDENNADDNHEPLCRGHHVSYENRLKPKRIKIIRPKKPKIKREVGILCKCGNLRRPGQRQCRQCHTAYVRAWRERNKAACSGEPASLQNLPRRIDT